MYERPESNEEVVFLASRAPYKKVTRSVCESIISKVLPDRKGKRSGFRITRKTFATRTLQSGVGIQKVSELLGHSTTNSTHKYISLDSERMMACPLSLTDEGIALHLEG